MEKSNFTGREKLTDNKGFINKSDAFFKSIEKSFDSNEPVKLDQLLNKMKNDEIDDETKKNLCIIQFGFVITNNKNEVLLINRTKKAHILTVNESVIQSISPYSKPEGKEYPYYIDYIKDYYKKQVKCDIEPASFNFLSIIKNTHDYRDYIFYIFQVKYNKDKSYFELEDHKMNGKLKLINQVDELKGFFRIDEKHIIDKIKNKKVDLRVAELLSGKKFGYDYGASKIFINPDKHSMNALFSADIKAHNYPQTFQIFNKKIKQIRRREKFYFSLEFSLLFLITIFFAFKVEIIYIFCLSVLLFLFFILSKFILNKNSKKELLNYKKIVQYSEDLTWRYMIGAVPYKKLNVDEEKNVDKKFIDNIKKFVAKKLGEDYTIPEFAIEGKEITLYMKDLRKTSFDGRKFYYEKYINNQEKYYNEKANSIKTIRSLFICSFAGIVIFIFIPAFLPIFKNLIEISIFAMTFIVALFEFSEYQKLFQAYNSTAYDLGQIISKHEQHINSENELSNYINEVNKTLKTHLM